MITDMKTFSFELVSPEERLMSQEAEMVSIPGGEGDFGVLPNHAAVLSTIRPGVIKVYTKRDDATPPKHVFVAGGFADVTPVSCSVLAEEAFDLEDLEEADVLKEIGALEDRIEKAKNEIEAERLTKRIAVENMKLDALRAYKAAA